MEPVAKNEVLEVIDECISYLHAIALIENIDTSKQYYSKSSFTADEYTKRPINLWISYTQKEVTRIINYDSAFLVSTGIKRILAALYTLKNYITNASDIQNLRLTHERPK